MKITHEIKEVLDNIYDIRNNNELKMKKMNKYLEKITSFFLESSTEQSLKEEKNKTDIKLFLKEFNSAKSLKFSREVKVLKLYVGKLIEDITGNYYSHMSSKKEVLLIDWVGKKIKTEKATFHIFKCSEIFFILFEDETSKFMLKTKKLNKSEAIRKFEYVDLTNNILENYLINKNGFVAEDEIHSLMKKKFQKGNFKIVEYYSDKKILGSVVESLSLNAKIVFYDKNEILTKKDIYSNGQKYKNIKKEYNTFKRENNTYNAKQTDLILRELFNYELVNGFKDFIDLKYYLVLDLETFDEILELNIKR